MNLIELIVGDNVFVRVRGAKAPRAGIKYRGSSYDGDTTDLAKAYFGDGLLLAADLSDTDADSRLNPTNYHQLIDRESTRKIKESME